MLLVSNIPTVLHSWCFIITDMLFFGLCPVRDEFYLVTCNYCQRVCTPQGLKNHIGKRFKVFLIHDSIFNVSIYWECQS